jgi:hypothetical protein
MSVVPIVFVRTGLAPVRRKLTTPTRICIEVAKALFVPQRQALLEKTGLLGSASKSPTAAMVIHLSSFVGGWTNVRTRKRANRIRAFGGVKRRIKRRGEVLAAAVKRAVAQWNESEVFGDHLYVWS